MKLKICKQQGLGLGWGVHLVEGCLLNRVVILVIGFCVLGSLVFGVCWTILEHDILEAYAVSAWILTLAMLFVATVQAHLEGV